MASDKPFAGDFLFVNHNANHMKASTHKKQVLSHVQNKYRSWKKKEDNRALKASIKSALPVSQQTSSASGERESSVTAQRGVRTKHARTLPIRPLTPPAQELIAGRETRRITVRSLITENEEEPDGRSVKQTTGAIVLSRPQSPYSLICKGNSDPFNVWAVKIDPAANDIISFYRDFILPALYHTTKHKWLTNASARQNWEACIHGWRTSDGLGDKGSGTAFIATCAAATALISRDEAIQSQSSHYHSKSLTLLRERLTRNDRHRGQIYWHINVVLDAESFNRNKTGAVAHLTMLRNFFVNENYIDPELLLHVVYHDIHISAMFLCRPTFDMDRWLPEKFHPLVDAARPYLPDMSRIKDLYLDPAIDSPRLRTLFIERRESLAVWLAQRRSEEESNHSCALLGWLQVRVYLHQGRLINLFLHADAQYKAGLPPELVNLLACQGYLSLATLLYIRSISFNATVRGVRFFDATQTILSSMREMLKYSEALGYIMYDKYENARLWALYVGASAELFMGVQPRQRGWFTTHFAAKAMRLHLDGDGAWDKVRHVLRGFLYTDMMHPNGAVWYEEVLSTSRTNVGDSELSENESTRKQRN